MAPSWTMATKMTPSRNRESINLPDLIKVENTISTRRNSHPPFITRWTGKIAPGVSDEMVCTIDLAASCATLAGASLQNNACLDSFDVSDALCGKEKASGRDHLVQQDNGQGWKLRTACGRLKLLRHDSKKTKNTGLRLQGRPVDTCCSTSQLIQVNSMM